MAIPTILKGDTSRKITLALAEGFDLSGCTLTVQIGLAMRTFKSIAAGEAVDIVLSAEETAAMPLGTSRLYFTITNANGETRTMRWAKIKVTDAPDEVYTEARIELDPATIVVDDLDAASSLGDVKARLNSVMAFLRAAKVALIAAVLPFSLFGVDAKYTTLNEMRGDAPIITNAAEYAQGVASAAKADAVQHAEALFSAVPRPDYTAANKTLVDTIKSHSAPDYETVSNRAMNAIAPYNYGDDWGIYHNDNFFSFPSASGQLALVSEVEKAKAEAIEEARGAQGAIWDAELGVAWEARMHNGALYYVAVTNRQAEATR